MTRTHLDVGRHMAGALLRSTDSMDLFVRRQPTPDATGDQSARPAVVYVHGATFPSGLSVAYPFDGRSWASELAAAGLDVWALDFAGFGMSEHYALQDQQRHPSDALRVQSFRSLPRGGDIPVRRDRREHAVR